MDDAELQEIQRMARKERMTTAEWVRQRLREAGAERSKPDIAAKLEAIRRAASYRFPALDIQQMNTEIEAGYLDDGNLPG